MYQYFGLDFSHDLIALVSFSYCVGYRCIIGSSIRWRDERIFCSVPLVTAVRGYIIVCIYTYIWLFNTLMMPTLLDQTFFPNCYNVPHERRLQPFGCLVTCFSMMGSVINRFGNLDIRPRRRSLLTSPKRDRQLISLRARALARVRRVHPTVQTLLQDSSSGLDLNEP